MLRDWSQMESLDKDKYRAEIFDALGHPVRITILKVLSGEPIGFADLKKRMGIESSGHLQHHLSKLGDLIKTDDTGKYCLSEYGREALFAVQTVERIAVPQTAEGGVSSGKSSEELWSKGFARLSLLVSLLSLAAFVWLQLASIDNPNFLFLMFSSFIFLGAATFLFLRTLKRSSEKRLCHAVAAILVITTLLVAFSLTQIPRGGYRNHALVTPQSFMLKVGHKGAGWYYGEHSQIVYSAGYSVNFAEVHVGMEGNVLIANLETPVDLNGTAYIFMVFKPYERNAYPVFQEATSFNETSTSEYYGVDIWSEWGDSGTRFEGYEIELMLRLDLTGPTSGPDSLNFTVDASNFMVYVDDVMVDSSLQNGASLILSGLFTAVNAFPLAQSAFKRLPKKTQGTPA